MTYEIEDQLAQAVLNYLATRPYQDVFQLIAQLQALKSRDDDDEQAKASASAASG